MRICHDAKKIYYHGLPEHLNFDYSSSRDLQGPIRLLAVNTSPNMPQVAELPARVFLLAKEQTAGNRRGPGLTVKREGETILCDPLALPDSHPYCVTH